MRPFILFGINSFKARNRPSVTNPTSETEIRS
jgi:hypothetical protein